MDRIMAGTPEIEGIIYLEYRHYSTIARKSTTWPGFIFRRKLRNSWNNPEKNTILRPDCEYSKKNGNGKTVTKAVELLRYHHDVSGSGCFQE